MTNDIEDVDNLLDKQDYETMNSLGFASTIKRRWRKLHSTFGGVGLYSFCTEQLIERLNLLLQHYNTGSALSKRLSTSLAYLQLQLGTNECSLDLDYSKWGHLAPLSWVKMLWRTLQVCGFELHLEYDTIPFPRVGDRLIMDLAAERLDDRDKVASISRVRGFLQAIFLSDIVTADGKFLEDFALDPERVLGFPRSTYLFPKECPSPDDWKVWSAFWSSATMQNFEPSSPLGKWCNHSHRRWEWHSGRTGEVLYRDLGDGTFQQHSTGMGRG